MILSAWLPLWAALAGPLPGARPSPPPILRQDPDSALIRRLGDAVNSTSDSLETLRGLAQGFRKDLQTASATLILERATAVQSACTAGAGAVRRLQGLLAARTIPKAGRSQASFRAVAEETVGALERCARTWSPLPRTDARADTLRAWGPYRAAELDQVLRRYDVARRKFSVAAGLPAPPIKN